VSVNKGAREDGKKYPKKGGERLRALVNKANDGEQRGVEAAYKMMMGQTLVSSSSSKLEE
jgi:hypothetical protein